MIRASRTIALVLIGTAAAAVPTILTTALRPSYDDIENGGGDFDNAYGPTTRSSYSGRSSYSHYSHSHWFWHSGGSGFSSSSGPRSSSSSHSSGTSRGGFGHTGHSSGS